MKHLTIAALLAFVIDQASKVIVVHWLDLQTRLVMDIFPPFLVFRMGWNTGINFGLFAGEVETMRWILTAIAVGVSIWLVIWARTQARPVTLVSCGLIVGGALANALDRVIYGAVADFLNMSCCGIENRFSFNVADIFIFAGAFGLVIFADEKKAA